MEQLLQIEIVNARDRLALIQCAENYTDTAMTITSDVLRGILGHNYDLDSPESLKECLVENSKDKKRIVATTDKAIMQELDGTADGTVIINIHEQMVEFRVWEHIESLDDYLEWYTVDESAERIKELPVWSSPINPTERIPFGAFNELKDYVFDLLEKNQHNVLLPKKYDPNVRIVRIEN